MSDVNQFGRILVLLGTVLIVRGALLWRFGGSPPRGRLPGDIVMYQGPATVSLPIMTSILHSLILTIMLGLIFRRT